MPRLSVILPTYKGAAYIAETIEAIKVQTFGEFEVIVIYKDSGDNTLDILKEHMDARFRIVKQLGNGYPNAMNVGLENASCDIICVQDDDDIPVPDRFERQINYLDTHQDIVAVSSAISFMDGSGKDLGVLDGIMDTDQLSSFEYLYCVRVQCAHVTMMFRRGPVDQGLRYDERFPAAPDFLFELNMFHGRKAYHFKDPMVRVRRNILSTMSETSIDDRFRQIRIFKTELRRKFHLSYTMYMRARSSDHFHMCGEYWVIGNRSRSMKNLFLAMLWNPFNWRIYRGVVRHFIFKEPTIPSAYACTGEI